MHLLTAPSAPSASSDVPFRNNPTRTNKHENWDFISKKMKTLLFSRNGNYDLESQAQNHIPELYTQSAVWLRGKEANCGVGEML